MTARLTVRGLTMSYGPFVIARDVDFEVRRGSVFVVIGGSGSGKTTLLRYLVGLMEPAVGEILYDGTSFTRAAPAERRRLLRGCGILFQSGALWSGLTLAENVALPLEELTSLDRPSIDELARIKLALVGLAGFEEFYPHQLSGGMQKRAGLARAMALDPDLLFLDEPSSGLDPPTARRLDGLILQLNRDLGSTIVVITHDVQSILAIADDGVFIDAEAGAVRRIGDPRRAVRSADDPRLRRFLAGGLAAVAPEEART